ncbi:MAG: four helix bundle protein [Patescibacteria group bacterium]
MIGAIKNFKDLNVYQDSYKASLLIHKEIVPNLPKEEQYDLTDQLRRSAKTIPRLIAEDYAKKEQVHGFQKYLLDAFGESNETIVSLSHCEDLYNEHVDTKLCQQLIDIYDKCSRQLFRLSESWQSFSYRHQKPNRKRYELP